MNLSRSKKENFKRVTNLDKGLHCMLRIPLRGLRIHLRHFVELDCYKIDFAFADLHHKQHHRLPMDSSHPSFPRLKRGMSKDIQLVKQFIKEENKWF